MDPTALIVTALGKAVSAGINRLAEGAAKDLYDSLRQKISALFNDNGHPQGLPEESTKGEFDDEKRDALVAALRAVKVGEHPEIVELAGQLAELLDPVGAEQRKYRVEVKDSQGVVIGDDAHVKMQFGGKDTT